MSDDVWLIRSRLHGRLPLRDGRWLLAHVLGRARVACTGEGLALLDAFARPRAVSAGELRDAAASRDPRARALDSLRAANLLRAAGNGEAERIRHAYSLALADPPAGPVALVPRTGAEVAYEPPVDATAWLALSPSLASLRLDDGSWLVTHPAGDPVRLDGALWAVAARFEGGATPRACAEVLGLAATAVRAACRFLLRKRVLWPVDADEAADAAAQAGEATGADVELLYPALNRWRQTHRAWTLDAVREARVEAPLALVGACKVQQVASALEEAARRAGWALDLRGFLRPEPGLADAAWLGVVTAASPFAIELYEAAAACDEARCRRAVPLALRRVEEAVRQVRRRTAAPLLMFSLGRPGLSAASACDAFAPACAAVFAEANAGLRALLDGCGPARLLDEDDLAASFHRGLFWDDEFNAATHHAPASSWSWAVLKAGETDGPYARDEVERAFPTRPPGQADPTEAQALAVVRALLALHTRRVEAVIFEPNELLWPGRVEERPDAPVAPSHYADVERYFYSGIHEAMAALRRAGVRLACASSCPPSLLRARWRDPSRRRDALRVDDLDAIAGGPSAEANVREVLRATGVREADALVIDLNRRPPDGLACRVYRGDRWGLRRYLLTAPELLAARR